MLRAAGYGKTVLLADFVRTATLPACWYFLNQTDTDPVVFLRTLLASIQRVFPHWGHPLGPVFAHYLQQNALLVQATSAYLLDELCASIAAELPDPFTLILSNYEEINDNEALGKLVEILLTRLPRHVMLIIESRVIPMLSFTSLVIRDEVCGVYTDILKFSAQDISELIHLQGLPSLSEEEASRITTIFDGWIAGSF